MADKNPKDNKMRPDDHRRKWDNAEYEKNAQARVELEEAIANARERKRDEPGPERDKLKARDYKVDIDSRLGKSTVITKNTPNAETGGYYCNVCDCVVKDSINFLDHINGKKHQRNLGMNMSIERSSLDQVKARFVRNKAKLEEKKEEYDLEQRTADLKEEEEKNKAYYKQKTKKRKHEEEAEEVVGDPAMLAMMGFGGFGSSSKKT